MAERKVYHTTYNSEKKRWENKLEGSERASSTHPTKHEAVQRGRELAQKPALGQLKIHKKDGKIQEERTYGADPRSSKG